ncbi:MAG: hypothetical protein O3C15_10605 [Proteobacteria bacterium]|nr:hypothetical protein [Pseudomonadota bacterium]NBX45409.1 hypothetical protein [Gammaproteobacteria bacterium]
MIKKIVALFIVLTSPLAFSQSNKPVIAVGQITSAITQFNTMSIQLALENALSKTGKFTIMERTRLDSLLKERGLSAAGITEGNASLGGFSGVDYLVYGSVSNITVSSKNLFIIMNCDATLSMNIRVVDVNSGEIRFSENLTAEQTVNTSPTDQDPCSGISLSSVNVIGEEASDGIANKMTMALFPIKVARVSGNEVYVNYGEGTLQKNRILSIKTIGEGFTDPDTGEVLGAEETTNAVIVVSDVRPSFSIGEVVVKRADVKIGDIAYLLEKSKRNERQVSSCVSAQTQRQKDCGKDPEGKRCASSMNKMSSACGALMEL